MTSVYDEKIYPPIPTATAPPDDDEGQAYRLQKIDELERVSEKRGRFAR